MEKLIYPACFYPAEDGSYTVYVPDLSGCMSDGPTLVEAIDTATDAASRCVLNEWKNGKPAPAPSRLKDIQPGSPDGFVSLLVLDMDAFAEKYGGKAVRKNVTIPAWLNTFAESQHINCSKVLRDALYAMFKNQK